MADKAAPTSKPSAMRKLEELEQFYVVNMCDKETSTDEQEQKRKWRQNVFGARWTSVSNEQPKQSDMEKPECFSSSALSSRQTAAIEARPKGVTSGEVSGLSSRRSIAIEISSACQRVCYGNKRTAQRRSSQPWG